METVSLPNALLRKPGPDSPIADPMRRTPSHLRGGPCAWTAAGWTEPAPRQYTSSVPPLTVRPARHRPGRVLAAALAVCVSTASCSVVGMKRLDPETPAGEQPDCTSTWTLPLIDTGVAAITGSAGVLLQSAAASKENDRESGTSFKVAGWSSIGLALVFIVSGGYGAIQRTRCRRAEVAYESAAPPQYIQDSQPLKGSAGAACKSDEDCGEDLVCGEPMKTCVPADQPDESPAP